jgi:hypothetical protein
MTHYLYTTKLSIFKICYATYLSITGLGYHYYGNTNFIKELRVFRTDALKNALLKLRSWSFRKEQTYVVQGSGFNNEAFN